MDAAFSKEPTLKYIKIPILSSIWFSCAFTIMALSYGKILCPSDFVRLIAFVSVLSLFTIGQIRGQQDNDSKPPTTFCTRIGIIVDQQASSLALKACISLSFAYFG